HRGDAGKRPKPRNADAGRPPRIRGRSGGNRCDGRPAHGVRSRARPLHRRGGPIPGPGRPRAHRPGGGGRRTIGRGLRRSAPVPVDEGGSYRRRRRGRRAGLTGLPPPVPISADETPDGIGLARDDGSVRRHRLGLAALGSGLALSLLAGCASSSAGDGPTSGPGRMQAEVATTDIYVNAPQRVAVGLIFADGKLVTFGSVGFSFSYLGTTQQPIAPQGGPEGAAGS